MQRACSRGNLALSGDSPTVKLSKYLPTVPQTHSIAVFVGAMARGYVSLLITRSTEMRADWDCYREDTFADGYVDEKIGISDYPLSASVSQITIHFVQFDNWTYRLRAENSVVRWKIYGISSNH